MKSNKERLGRVITIGCLGLCIAFAVACDNGGGGGGGGDAEYKARIASYKAEYGKSDEWETWMIANKARYTWATNASASKPVSLTIAYRYEEGSTFTTDWPTEQGHMDAFSEMAEACFSGYDFNFVFEGNTSTSYANVIGGISENWSRSMGKDVWLYYEGIFNHEFCHTMGLPHHYDSMETCGDGQHMPPGDSDGCLMDRNSYLLCSACRTALGIPLDIDEDAAIAGIEAAMGELASHVLTQ